MNHRKLLLSAAALSLIAAGVALGATASAQDPSDPLSVPGAGVLGQAKDFSRTPAEDEVWQLYQDEKLLTARRKAEELLRDQPDSIVGHYIFAQILRRAEGNLPKSMKQMGRARELYELKYKPTVNNVSETPWMLHREILYAAQTVAGELERHDYQLQLLDYHDSLYDPRLTAEHAWPLMLLGRYDEARHYAEKAADDSDSFQRSLGRNALCAIEGEARTRTERFDACLAAYDDAAARARSDDPFANPDTITSVTVHAYNAAVAAMSVLRPDEAERLAQAGATRLEFTPANPWRLLVRLYTDQGRMDDAVMALREMQAWRRKQPPHLRVQVRAETDVAFATVLLVAAQTQTGMSVIDRAIANPDRRGLTSSSKDQALGAHALLRRALRTTHAQIEAERATWSGTAEALKIALDASERRIQNWTDAERIRGVLNNDDRLVSSFRVYVAGGLEPVPSWLIGDLIPILGAGVCSVALDRVRAAESDAALEPYYLAFEAEIALHRGDERAAYALATQALDTLPEFEALLRARVAAIAGELAWALAKPELALGLWATAMQRDAGVIRRRGLALPATLTVKATGPVATRLAALLESSPRFDFGQKRGFTVSIEGSGRALEVCLLEPEGGVLSCAATPPEQQPSPDSPGEEQTGADQAPPLQDNDYAALTAEAFHARAFAMPVGLSNIDLGSLDGTATIADEANRERMQGLLDKVKAEAEAD